MNIPSIKTIKTRLTWLNKVGDPDVLAKQIRKELEWFRDNSGGREAHVRALMNNLNLLLNTHGVEYIRHKDDDLQRIWEEETNEDALQRPN